MSWDVRCEQILYIFQLWSHLYVFLDLLVFLLSRKEFSLREGLPQCLLGHEGLQLQQSWYSAVLANETRAIGIKVDCGEGNPTRKKKKVKCCASKNRNILETAVGVKYLFYTMQNVCDYEPPKIWYTDPVQRSAGAGWGSQSGGSMGYSDQELCTLHLKVAGGAGRILSLRTPALPGCKYESPVPRHTDRWGQEPMQV